MAQKKKKPLVYIRPQKEKERIQERRQSGVGDNDARQVNDYNDVVGGPWIESFVCIRSELVKSS